MFLRMQTVTAVLLAVSFATAAAPAAAQAEPATREPFLDVGGAVRFSYGWTDFGPDTDVELELVRVDLSCGAGRITCSLQHRWYDGFDTLQHAWIGWEPNDSQRIRAGVQQVPFGLLPVASHSFWFGSGYYLGLEDDYDLGVAWKHEGDGWRHELALFVSDEYGTGRRHERYSFDVATVEAHPYRERERMVGRIGRTLDHGEWTLDLGASASMGRVERRPDGRHFDHHAGALHAAATRGPLELQAQWIRYRYDVPGNRIALSAFGAPFEVAAEADVFTGNVAWTFEPAGWFDSVTCYNDASSTRVHGTRLADSIQNVTGCSFSRGAMVVYLDWIAGRNMWFAGGPGIGIVDEANTGWHSRLNLNVGFYF